MPRSAALEHVLQEVGNEVRSRREPEHLFTAAAVGAMGAIAGGTAAVATVSALANVPLWQHPAIVGALTCLLIGAAIVLKTERENRVYRSMRREQTRLYALYAREHGLLNTELPPGLQAEAKVGKGHWFSSAIVVVAAIGSSTFCASIWIATQPREPIGSEGKVRQCPNDKITKSSLPILVGPLSAVAGAAAPAPAAAATAQRAIPSSATSQSQRTQ